MLTACLSRNGKLRPKSPASRSAKSGRGDARTAPCQRERLEALQSILRLRKEAFAEIEKLIALIDASDEYVQTEREHDDSELENDGEDREPDLGSFDRMMNQARSCSVTPSATILDAEVDNS